MPTLRNPYKSIPLTTRKLLPKALTGWGLALLAGTLAGLAAFKSGINELTAAQLTMGATGLVVGWTYTRMARVTGGSPTLIHLGLIAAIQAAILIMGVTPLYAAIGSTLKLSLLAFYSFSFTGALGGLGLYFIFKSIFPDRVPGYPAALLTIGYFSLGLAAGTASAVELLGNSLPGAFSGLLSLGLIVLLAGTGSAASIAFFLSGQPGSTPPAADTGAVDPGLQHAQRRFATLALICIVIPFYLNDLSNIYIDQWGPWLAIDYLFTKAYPLLILVYLVKTNHTTWSGLGLTPQKPILFTTVFLVGTLSILFILENNNFITRFVSGYPALGRIPEITDSFWHKFDLFAGLGMVALVEELVFRGFFCFVLEKYTRRPAFIVIFSAIAFGLIHWSAGFADATAAAVAGMVYMVLYLQTRSLPAIILSHFVVDLISFSRIIPAGLLVFM